MFYIYYYDVSLHKSFKGSCVSKALLFIKKKLTRKFRIYIYALNQDF